MDLGRSYIHILNYLYTLMALLNVAILEEDGQYIGIYILELGKLLSLPSKSLKR